MKHFFIGLAISVLLVSCHHAQAADCHPVRDAQCGVSL